MAKALDYNDDEELIFQMQLNEIKKISNPKEETEVLCDLFPIFCETDGRVGITNKPLKFDGKTAFADITSEQSNSQKDLGDEYDSISVHFNLESPELQGSSEMNGGNFKRPDRPFKVFPRSKSMKASPIKHQTKDPHDVLRCDSMRQEFDSDPGDRIRNVYEDLNPRENLLGVKLNSNDGYKSCGDRLIPEQVQFEMDNEIATELEKDDINNIEEQDRILAQYMQLESDLESAQRLDKHTNGRGKSRKMGLLMHGNDVNISQTNNDLSQRWSNSSPFEMQRNSHLYQRYKQHPDQLRFLRGTTYRVRPTSVQFLNRVRATDFTTQNNVTTEPQPRSAPAHNIMLSTQEMQRGPLGLQHQLLRHNGSRLLRRPSFDFPADDIDVDGLDYEEILELEEQIGEVKSLGLQHSDIETLPKETITNLSQIEKKQCCICLEDFRLNDIVRKLPCLHMYHIDCIDCWLKRKAECPVCKKNVKGATSKNG